jgi:uncharacterized protein DUF4242
MRRGVLDSMIEALGPSRRREETEMPRYLVERTFPDGLPITTDDAGAKAVAQVVATNTEHGVTWIHSYVAQDRRTTWCVYDGPSPEAIRHAAIGNCLPIDRIVEVRVLDPYFYGGAS